MDLYHKRTDTEKYLLTYAKKCLKNISSVIIRQICTMAENDLIKSKHVNELKRIFKPKATLRRLLKFEYQKHFQSHKKYFFNPKPLIIIILLSLSVLIIPII